MRTHMDKCGLRRRRKEHHIGNETLGLRGVGSRYVLGPIKQYLSRDDFETIRSHLRVYPASAYSHAVASTDPLWHSRRLMEKFMKNAAKLAVPEGTSAFDENTARTKARTSAKSYIPSKPDKYGIRFYAGNKTGEVSG